MHGPQQHVVQSSPDMRSASKKGSWILQPWKECVAAKAWNFDVFESSRQLKLEVPRPAESRCNSFNGSVIGKVSCSGKGWWLTFPNYFRD